MSSHNRAPSRHAATRHNPAPRVGLFGLLGSGNIGNDGSADAVLAYLRDKHPDAVVDFMCAGPDPIVERYDMPAIRLHWNRHEYHTAASVPAILRKGFGKLVDAFRTAAWVRRHDAVIVPGMGVLEATLPLRPWGFPYSLFLLCLSGRLFRTKVALVSVGANTSGRPMTRRLFTMAARLAAYRSYRDDLSREAMRASGLDVANDSVYPDLAFALPTPPGATSDTGTIGVGVMAYSGTNDDRGHANEIYTSYVAKIKRFTHWLVEDGHRIRLFIGDQEDQRVVAEVIDDLRAHRLSDNAVTAVPASSLVELMNQMGAVDVVVATRYHNVLCALKMARPTVSIGYSKKNDVLMASMALGEYCQEIRALDVDLLIEQFVTVRKRRDYLRTTLAELSAASARRLDEQFEILSATLFPRRRRTHKHRTRWGN